MHLPFLGRSDSKGEAVDRLDDDGAAFGHRHAFLLEIPQTRAPERAVELHLADRRGHRAHRRHAPERARGGPLRTASRCAASDFMSSSQASARPASATATPAATTAPPAAPAPESASTTPAVSAAAAPVPSAPCDGTCASATMSAAPTTTRMTPSVDHALSRAAG